MEDKLKAFKEEFKKLNIESREYKFSFGPSDEEIGIEYFITGLDGNPNLQLNFDNEEEKEKYLSELAKKYGNGIHREQFKETKRIIDYVVVVKDGKADEYKKIKYDWGGLYFFKNGKSTSSAIYITETK